MAQGGGVIDIGGDDKDQPLFGTLQDDNGGLTLDQGDILGNLQGVDTDTDTFSTIVDTGDIFATDMSVSLSWESQQEPHLWIMAEMSKVTQIWRIDWEEIRTPGKLIKG